jgi:hypothetical protein
MSRLNGCWLGNCHGHVVQVCPECNRKCCNKHIGHRC